MFRTLIHPSSGACRLQAEAKLQLCFSLQHGHHSHPAAPNLQHTTNREHNNRCDNSTAKSQAPDDGYINVRNMLSTYLLTPWCRVLLEKLTGLQLVKKFPAFHGTPRFITALTSVRHMSLFWASPVQSIYPHPTS